MELVLPNNYIEIEEEEMMYLDGGYYLNDYTVDSILFAVNAVGIHSVYAMKKALSHGVYVMAAKMSKLPYIGKWCAFAFVAYYQLNSAQIAGAFFGAAVRGKGMDISVGWHWGIIPYASLSVR